MAKPLQVLNFACILLPKIVSLSLKTYIMKARIFILALCTCLSLALNAQVTKKPYNDKQNMEVVLEREPAFPGGERALYQYFYDSLNFSEEAIALRIEGEIMASFDVMPDSTLSNVQIISGLGYGIDEAFTQLLKKLKYLPSIQNGTPLKANVILSIPVRARKQ